MGGRWRSVRQLTATVEHLGVLLPRSIPTWRQRRPKSIDHTALSEDDNLLRAAQLTYET